MVTLTNQQIKNSKRNAISNAANFAKNDSDRFPVSYNGMKKTTLKSIENLIPDQKKMFTIFLNRVFKHYFSVNY